MTILNPITFPVILESLLASNDLTEEQSKYLMNSWLENKIEPICISLKEYIEMQSLFKINSQSYQIHRINHK